MRQVIYMLNLRIQNFLAGKTRAHVCNVVFSRIIFLSNLV